MRCPYCTYEDSRVLDTSHDSRGGIRRRRECISCHQRFSTYERPILATPLIIKQDGTREEFDREKVARWTANRLRQAAGFSRSYRKAGRGDRIYPAANRTGRGGFSDHR